MNGRQAAVIGGAIGLLALLGFAGTASASEPSGGGPGPGPDPEDCEDLQDQLAAQTAARADMQNARAALLQAINQNGPGTDEELLVQLAELDGQIANMNQMIAATNAQLEACS